MSARVLACQENQKSQPYRSRANCVNREFHGSFPACAQMEPLHDDVMELSRLQKMQESPAAQGFL
jgi:hypothetical protein